LDGLSRKTDVMHIEPDGMADAMHEVFLESRRIRVLLPNGPLAQQAEADQLLLDVLLGFLLPVLGQFPRLEPADLLAQNSKHRIVDLLLPAREPAAGWNRASHVRVVTGEGSADVHQNQLAFAALGGVIDIVQRASVEAAGDNRRVGKGASGAGELVPEFRFDLRFSDARTRELEHTAKAFPGQRARLADQLDLVLGFYNAQLVQQPGKAVIVVERIALQCLGHKTRFAGFDIDDRPLVLVGIEVNVFALAHEPMEQTREFAEPGDLLNATECPRL